jgi:N-acetylmuramic acid 6-phosphate etherase
MSLLKPGDKKLFDYLSTLETEQRNKDTTEIDTASALEIVRHINTQDKTVAFAVEQKLPEIAEAIELIVDAFKKGGRFFYTGSGTSGRIGIVDASECPPTFGTSPDLVQGIIAGGKEAVFRAQEGAEDSEYAGEQSLVEFGLKSGDVLCGLAASGRTPFVLGSLKKATEMGVKTILVCCVPASQLQLSVAPNVIIDIHTGPEVIMGSTRMKSATAQKMVCNMLTTGSMIRLGKVFENVMVDLQLTNKKLEERARRIIMMFSDCTYDQASYLIEQTNGHVKTALVMALTGCDIEQATSLLTQADGFVKGALKLADL